MVTFSQKASPTTQQAPLFVTRSQDSNPWPSFDGLAAKALMQLLESGLGNERAKLGRV